MNAKEPQQSLPLIISNDENVGAGYNGPRPSDGTKPAAPPPPPPPKEKSK